MWFIPVSGLYFRLKAKEHLLLENGFCWIRQIQINWALRAEGLKERRRVCDTQTLGCDLVTEQQQILMSAWYYCISLCTDKEIEVWRGDVNYHVTASHKSSKSTLLRSAQHPCTNAQSPGYTFQTMSTKSNPEQWTHELRTSGDGKLTASHASQADGKVTRMLPKRWLGRLTPQIFQGYPLTS